MQHDLAGQCRARGIFPLVMEPGDDLATLAAAAVSGGADVIGMAGGDGSQAVVATVAAQHDLPYVCVPAGTRNHFALDIGVGAHDVVGALDAFSHAAERRIDLARVNDRVFVNNASMGVYGRVVQSPQYRQAKLRTVIENLPELLGPDARPADLRFTGPDGSQRHGAVVLLVSNNRYRLDPAGTKGSREGMNQGLLGIVAVLPPQPHPLQEWTATTFRVDSGEAVDVGLDGEAVVIDPPLVFDSLPSALRLRVPVRERRARAVRFGRGPRAGPI